MKNKYFISNMTVWIKRYDDQENIVSSKIYYASEYLDTMYDLVVVKCEKDPYLLMAYTISLLAERESIVIYSQDRLDHYELGLYPGKYFKEPSNKDDFLSLINQISLLIEDKKSNLEFHTNFLSDRSMTKHHR